MTAPHTYHDQGSELPGAKIHYMNNGRKYAPGNFVFHRKELRGAIPEYDFNSTNISSLRDLQGFDKDF
jgi:hypothetical protein